MWGKEERGTRTGGRRRRDDRRRPQRQERQGDMADSYRATFSGGLIYGDFQRRTHTATLNGGLIRRFPVVDSYGDIQRRTHTATLLGGLIRRFSTADSYGDIQWRTRTAAFNGDLIMRYGGLYSNTQWRTHIAVRRRTQKCSGQAEAGSGGENRRTYKTARDDTTRLHYSREAVKAQGHKAGCQNRTQRH